MRYANVYNNYKWRRIRFDGTMKDLTKLLGAEEDLRELPKDSIYCFVNIMCFIQIYNNKQAAEIYYNEMVIISKKENINNIIILHKNCDKYYTKRNIAQFCFEHTKKILRRCHLRFSNVFFIEPSAGSGIFLDVLTVSAKNKVGLDIEPTSKKVLKYDFLQDDLFTLLSNFDILNKKIIFIGNPPFGTKAKLAIDFVNKACEYSSFIGFVVPIQFRKWSVQSKINKNLKLVLDVDLPEDAFEFIGKDYNLRCCFQIWINNDFYTTTTLKDIRIKHKPELSHPDFIIYQYNRTIEAEKYFDYDWDFAVIRQGFADYSFRALNKDECNKKQQWIFFKAKNEIIKNILLNIDFIKLSKKNITIPGFGKADVVEEYNKIQKDYDK